MRRVTILHRSVGVLALSAALLLGGCEAAADLIPGDANNPRTPTPTSAAEATPILVTPGLNVGTAETPAATIPDHELARAVVQVLAIDTTSGSEQVARYGSGAIVDAEQRLVLTSYRVVSPYRADGSTAYTRLAVALNTTPGEPAGDRYAAEIVIADVDMGVAVIRLTEPLDGQEDEFDLPPVLMGQATGMGNGVPLRLFGHVGGSASTDPVSVTQATIVGQRGEAGQTGRTWLKIDARLPVGVSGGPAFNQSGQLVGMLAQEQYVPQGQVGLVRPVDVFAAIIERARTTSGTFTPPLYRGVTIPSDGVWVSRPAFAANAVESSAGRDLLDYGSGFAEGLAALYYEYTVLGAQPGTVIEERWYLDGVAQDSLSSSFVWDQGGYGLISDRIAAPGAAGIPRGTWRVEAWVGGAVRATASATIGLPAPTAATPNAVPVGGATLVAPDGSVLVGPYTTAPQLLALFDLSGMASVGRVQWVVFRDNQPVHTSPPVQWTQGNGGRFWVGYSSGDLIPSGTWEFELLADGQVIGVTTITLF
ncbi:MAG: serine protease [Chloroflexi bacterium]|nr:serine protease [Chloroflexota bacterium]MDA1239505.1 serine protease [Chloroflexota bacterium]